MSVEEIQSGHYLQDVFERTFEVATQFWIDIVNRIIGLERFEEPFNYYKGTKRVGKKVILDEFAKEEAPIAGLRNPPHSPGVVI